MTRSHSDAPARETSSGAAARDALQSLLDELEQFGAANDAVTDQRPGRMLNITRGTGVFLSVLVRACAARRVLEIGTSNGYSTLWLADAARTVDGVVTTIEVADHKVALARETFARSGLQSGIVLVHDDAGRFLARGVDDAYDLVFLDAERQEYLGWWPHLRRSLRPGGVLVVDNATSHPEQLAPLIAAVNADAGFTTCLVPVGNGEFLAVKDV
jgi:predicted O-methyltransferase YrrM